MGASTASGAEGLTYFGIYMTVADTAVVMCAFLRDCGHPAPANQLEVRMRFGQFVEFVFDVQDYMLAIPERFCHPFAKSIPISMRIDYAARWFFPVIIIGKI